MPRFPVDAPKAKVIRSLQLLGFQIIREREHIAMLRRNADGSTTPLTLPNHPHIKGSTLRTICTQAGIARPDFLRAYEQS
ncbi:MAG TPA: type II toxin-antitoxin system HicA family toxin [Tepidisphaeraceae bacterium]|jgi:predicted RNA binding protein YcfA (HicA-like mRNA interferase family)